MFFQLLKSLKIRKEKSGNPVIMGFPLNRYYYVVGIVCICLVFQLEETNRISL